ncbi:BTB/POZ domain-containing protein, partial [Orchesella cincta]
KLLPLNNDGELVEATQNYCKKLSELIGNDELGKENMWQLCAHFKWDPNNSKQMAVRVHGRLLEELRDLCSEFIKLKFEGTIAGQPFITKAMWIFAYYTIDKVSDEGGCWEFNHAIQAYCEDVAVKLPQSIISYSKLETTEFVTVTASSIRFKVKDSYIYLQGEEESMIGRRCQLKVLKTIMCHEASSDISIQGIDDVKVPAHKCFLIAQSPVLKEMLQQYTFGRLKLADISLNCLRALLEYLYTFEISRAVKSPKVAVDLFVAANKYEIQPLQDKLAKMILERRIGWFHITPTLDLFLCVRKLGKTTTTDELKRKIGQVLKWNGKELIMQSEGYQRLVVDDISHNAHIH